MVQRSHRVFTCSNKYQIYSQSRVVENVGQIKVIGIIHTQNNLPLITGSDGAVAMSLAKGLVGTWFASRYLLQLGAGFYRLNG